MELEKAFVSFFFFVFFPLIEKCFFEVHGFLSPFPLRGSIIKKKFFLLPIKPIFIIH